MTDPATVEAMRAHIVPLLAAVAREDLPAVQRIYTALETEFRVEGKHAAAMLLADEVQRVRIQSRRFLANANSEAARYAEAYLDQKRRTEEWQDIAANQAEVLGRYKAKLRELGGKPG